jgi:hypothetical protein
MAETAATQQAPLPQQQKRGGPGRRAKFAGHPVIVRVETPVPGAVMSCSVESVCSLVASDVPAVFHITFVASSIVLVV